MFPAAVTKIPHANPKFCIASSIHADCPAAPKLALIILAPFSLAKSMALIINELVREFLSPTLSAIILAYGLIPTVPSPLFICAAIIPATWVPCVLVAGSGNLSLSVKSYP